MRLVYFAALACFVLGVSLGWIIKPEHAPIIQAQNEAEYVADLEFGLAETEGRLAVYLDMFRRSQGVDKWQ